MLEIGDLVVVTNCGKQYTTYTEFYQKNKTFLSKPYITHNKLYDGDIGVVTSIANHITDKDEVLALINVEDNSCIVHIDGLKKINKGKTTRIDYSTLDKEERYFINGIDITDKIRKVERGEI